MFREREISYLRPAEPSQECAGRERGKERGRGNPNQECI